MFRAVSSLNEHFCLSITRLCLGLFSCSDKSHRWPSGKGLEGSAARWLHNLTCRSRMQNKLRRAGTPLIISWLCKCQNNSGPRNSSFSTFISMPKIRYSSDKSSGSLNIGFHHCDNYSSQWVLSRRRRMRLERNDSAAVHAWPLVWFLWDAAEVWNNVNVAFFS